MEYRKVGSDTGEQLKETASAAQESVSNDHKENIAASQGTQAHTEPPTMSMREHPADLVPKGWML